MSNKVRKPRISPTKVQSAEHYLGTMHKIINMLQAGSDSDLLAVVMEYSKDIKSMQTGKEFLEDLIQWQKWRVNESQV